MSENLKELTPSEIKRLLLLLSDELRYQGKKAIIYVVGGANISLTLDISRTTKDIDTVIKDGYDAVMAAAQAVAAREPGLGHDWINSEFTGGNNPIGGLQWQWFDNRSVDIPTTYLATGSLIVETASPEMMLALKTIAGREHDVQDAHKLMRMTGLRTYVELLRNLETFTGPRLFQAQGQPTTSIHIRDNIRLILDNAPEDLRPPRKVNRLEKFRSWRKARRNARSS